MSYNVSATIHAFMQAANASDAADAISAVKTSDIGTIAALPAPLLSALGATTAIPSTLMPLQCYHKPLTGDLALTDTGSSAEGAGYRLTVFGDTVDRTVSFPASGSQETGGNITDFLVPANTSRTFTRQVINGSFRVFGDPPVANLNPQMEICRWLGGNDCIQTFNMGEMGASATMSSGSIGMQMLWVPSRRTITGAKWYQVVSGDYTTSSNYNGWILYSVTPAGVMTVIASSTHQADIWKASPNTWNTKAFSSTVVLERGAYALGALYNNGGQVTAPTIGARAALSNSAIYVPNLTSSNKLSGSLGAQTTVADKNMSDFTATTSQRYYELY